ncbi:MAG: cupredoxin domain-containing protein [Chloroflexi bacterium]|nr:cupredoxin domain-containing protein [Chloroflexota bacterium]
MTTSLLIAILPSIAVAVTSLAILLVLKARRSRARLDAEGFQELQIEVKGKYRPDSVVVRRGIPLRLHFIRREDTACSERVIFSDFHVGSRLPAFRSTSVCFIPTKCGEFLFTCAFGMYQGRLVVVEPTVRDLAKIRGAASAKRERNLPHVAARHSTALGFLPSAPNTADQDPGDG